MDGQRVVVPLDPPSESKPGDRVYVEGFSHEERGGKYGYFCTCHWMLEINWIRTQIIWTLIFLWYGSFYYSAPDKQLNPKKKVFEALKVLTKPKFILRLKWQSHNYDVWIEFR